jgi:hypothetical protein
MSDLSTPWPSTSRSRHLEKHSGWVAAAAILLVAAMLSLPACFGVRTNDSFWIDWVWLDQFARELGNGTIYPRWLPMSHQGLGSPVFYYYPPLSFYVGSPFALAGMTTYAALIATFFTAYLLSAVGMYWWLKPQARTPLIGALIYVIAPYHAFNFYARGAVAETFATAVLPFVMLGVSRLARRERGGFLLVATGYAALIMAHLPFALLASIFLIGPYSLLQTRTQARQLLLIGSALAVGLALAAVYLVPAFALEPYRDTAKLWENPVLHPSNWTFWNSTFRTSQNYIAVLVISLALAVPLAGLMLRHRSGWAMFGLACLVLGIGVVPAVWSLPLLRSVQFPFRILPLAEFALATAIAASATRPPERVIACLTLLIITVPITASTYPPAISVDELRAFHPDVPENLPPGERPHSWPSQWALKVAASHRRARFSNGVTVLPVFYYPAWRVNCAGRIVPGFAEPKTQLLAYQGSPNCSIELEQTAAERIGRTITLLAVVGFLVMALLSLFASNRKQADPVEK